MNAKELILEKINCGTNFANMYLFLITLGFDIKDIVAFMTSPVVTFVDNITNSNIFTDDYFSIDRALSMAQGVFDETYLKKYISDATLNSYNYFIKEAKKNNTNPFIKINNDPESLYAKFNKTNEDNIEELIVEVNDKLKKGEIEELKNLFITDNGIIHSRKKAIEFDNYLYAIKSINHLRNFDPKDENIIKDIEEFKKVRKGALEFTNAAKFLGVNQGIKTSKHELNKFILSMLDAYSSRFTKEEKESLPEEFLKLDVYRFLSDDQYKLSIIDIYNDHKVCLNLFAMIDLIPLYKSIYNLLRLIIDVDKNMSVKSILFNKMYSELKTKGHWNISELYLKDMLKGIDQAIIRQYLQDELDLTIPYKAGTVLIDGYKRNNITTRDGFINFNDISGIESFKKYFEEVVIPNLKKGVIVDVDTNGQITEKLIEGLASNYFIGSLIRSHNGDIPMYKCNIDMMSAKNTESSSKQLSIYVRGLRELSDSKYSINGTKLSDLFMLYNLIVNQNQYGSDRMTTLFESFLQNNFGENSLLYKYFKWLGNKDYFMESEDFDIKLEDVMLAASRISSYESGQTDPSYIHLNEDGSLTFKIRNGYKYENSKINLLTPISDTSAKTRIERMENHKRYSTLGGSFSNYIMQTMDLVKALNAETLSVLKDLYRKGVLEIQKICK